MRGPRAGGPRIRPRRAPESGRLGACAPPAHADIRAPRGRTGRRPARSRRWRVCARETQACVRASPGRVRTIRRGASPRPSGRPRTRASPRLARRPSPAAGSTTGARWRRRRARSDSTGTPRCFGIEPRPAGRELGRARLLVDPALAASLPLEVLDRVRDVGELAVDSGRLEPLVENAPGRPDERLSGQILLVPGLLANEDDLGGAPALPEDGLRARLPEVARPAAGGRLAELRQRGPLGDERSRRPLVERQPGLSFGLSGHC